MSRPHRHFSGNVSRNRRPAGTGRTAGGHTRYLQHRGPGTGALPLRFPHLVVSATSLAGLNGSERRAPSRRDAHETAVELVGPHIKPERKADILDVVLKEEAVIIPVIRCAREDQMRRTITTWNVFGRHVGLDRMLGHCFFFARDEVELLALEAAP